MSKLTEAEQAELKARWDAYQKQHMEACARGEHEWRLSKWGWRECKYCLAGRHKVRDYESGSGATPDEPGAPDT